MSKVKVTAVVDLNEVAWSVQNGKIMIRTLQKPISTEETYESLLNKVEK